MKAEVEVTMGDDIQTVLNDIRERLVRVETKLDDYNGLRDKAETSYTIASNAQKAIEKIEDNLKWLWRTAVGALIVAAVTALIKFGM